MNVDAAGHVRGDSLFIDDIPILAGTLYAVPLGSSVAHAKIKKIDFSKALLVDGVIRILTSTDIPGENQVGGIIKDETLLAQSEVHYRGQPLALVVAKSEEIAREARTKIEVELQELKALLDPREAFKHDKLIMPPVTFSSGDVQSAFAKCDVVVEGRVDSGGQEHLYLETQGAIAALSEDGGIKLISSTQGPTAVQRTVANVLNLPMNKVSVEVHRLGGGFGGKEDQASAWAAMAALATYLIKQPVKLVLSRHDDMCMTGKRHPYSSDYKIGLTKEGQILAFECTYYQDAGAAADLSPAILGRTLFHANGSYYIPNVNVTGISCKTNVVPNTAFRGFGGPQGLFVIEAAISRAAQRLGMPVHELQKMNLLKDGDEFHYGMAVKNCTAQRAWRECEERYNTEDAYQRAAKFNSENFERKKGVAMMPICFGISFTKTQMNQASALVHLYTDGSLGITTAAVEMGQGVNTKLVQVAAKTLSMSPKRIRIQSTGTDKIANTYPSAASSEPDLNGKAVESACKEIYKRLCVEAGLMLGLTQNEQIELKDELFYIAGKKADLRWEQVIDSAHRRRTSLSAHAHYATPDIYFDLEKKKGRPFAYHVFGTALIEVTLDCLRGTFSLDALKIVHDFGESFSPLVDLGQVEGALAQGIGWMTLEEILFNEKGKLLSDTLSTYKVPDINWAPKELMVHFLENSENPPGILNSKAVGEPPFLYGIGVYFALENAIRAFNPKAKLAAHAPMTHERTLMALYSNAANV